MPAAPQLDWWTFREHQVCSPDSVLSPLYSSFCLFLPSSLSFNLDPLPRLSTTCWTTEILLLQSPMPLGIALTPSHTCLPSLCKKPGGCSRAMIVPGIPVPQCDSHWGRFPTPASVYPHCEVHLRAQEEGPSAGCQATELAAQG